MNEFLNEANNITALTETTKSGITKNFVEVNVETKDENGNKHIVTRKIYNELAVNTLVTIEQLSFIRNKSLKALVLSFGKITDKVAESVGLKSAKALIKTKFPEYSDNTISKYRRIALLFSNSLEDASDFTYCEFIPQDTPISNLDVVLTLFKDIDVEKSTKEEREKALSDFYDKYIITDTIHLSASQQALKKEVREIVNPTIITVEANEVDNTNTEEENTNTEDNTNTEEENTNTEEENTNTEDFTNSENDEIVNRAFAILKVKIHGNKKAEKLFTQFLEELEKIE